MSTLLMANPAMAGNRQAQGQFQTQDLNSNEELSNTNNIDVGNGSSLSIDSEPIPIVYPDLCDRPGLSFGFSGYGDYYGPQVMFTIPLGANTCAADNRLQTEANLASYCLQLAGRVSFEELGDGLDRCPSILGLPE